MKHDSETSTCKFTLSATEDLQQDTKTQNAELSTETERLHGELFLVCVSDLYVRFNPPLENSTLCS